MQKIDRESKIAKARDYFLSGYNCAQAVFASYADEMGLSETLALKISSGFGGGMAGMRGVCGAISGMFMVFSTLRGYDTASDITSKKQLYAQLQGMTSEFTDEFEVLHCKALLQRNGILAKSEPNERTPEYYRTRPCVRYVEKCAGLLADKLNEG